MPFKKGQSGNPAGRAPGIIDRRRRMAQAYIGEFDAVVTALIDKAKEGDVAAAALYLSRVEPPLRARAERVHFKLDSALPLADQAQQVVAAVAAGELDPDSGKLLVDCLTAAAGLKSIDEFEVRLARLEASTVSRPVRGGIVEQRMQ